MTTTDTGTIGLDEAPPDPPEMVDHDELVELRRKAAIYDALAAQEAECERLMAAWHLAKESATAAKRAYEAGTEELRRLIRAQNEELPLFDQVDTTDDSWREVPLAELGMTTLTAEQLAEAGVVTIGDLAEWSSDGKRLTDIAGIGPAKAEAIEGFLDEFWAAHPGIGQAEPALEDDDEEDA